MSEINDPVNAPAHYMTEDREVIDQVRDGMSDEDFAKF